MDAYRVRLSTEEHRRCAVKRDCTEGCADDGHKHKWEIEPSGTTDFDVFVSDDDEDAAERLNLICDDILDELEPGQSRTITIRCNSVSE